MEMKNYKMYKDGRKLVFAAALGTAFISSGLVASADDVQAATPVASTTQVMGSTEGAAQNSQATPAGEVTANPMASLLTNPSALTTTVSSLLGQTGSAAQINQLVNQATALLNQSGQSDQVKQLASQAIQLLQQAMKSGQLQPLINQALQLISQAGQSTGQAKEIVSQVTSMANQVVNKSTTATSTGANNQASTSTVSSLTNGIGTNQPQAGVNNQSTPGNLNLNTANNSSKSGSVNGAVPSSTTAVNQSARPSTGAKTTSLPATHQSVKGNDMSAIELAVLTELSVVSAGALLYNKKRRRG